MWRFTLRWFTTQRFDACRYSIGSSIVRMCSARSSLIRFTSAAIVDDLPHADGPVISTMPWWKLVNFASELGRPEVVERRRLQRDAPEGRVEPAQLAVDVRAEARETLHRVAEVDLAVLLEQRALLGGER